MSPVKPGKPKDLRRAETANPQEEELRIPGVAERSNYESLEPEGAHDKLPKPVVSVNHTGGCRMSFVHPGTPRRAGGAELMEALFVFIPDWGRSDRACQKDARRDVEEEKECQGEKHAGVTLHE